MQIGRDTLRAADRPACRTRQCVTQKQAVQAVPCGAGAPLSLFCVSCGASLWARLGSHI